MFAKVRLKSSVYISCTVQLILIRQLMRKISQSKYYSILCNKFCLDLSGYWVAWLTVLKIDLVLSLSTHLKKVLIIFDDLILIILLTVCCKNLIDLFIYVKLRYHELLIQVSPWAALVDSWHCHLTIINEMLNQQDKFT